MTPNRYPNEEETRILKIRFNPDGRWYDLHPKDLDLEHYVQRHGGKATVKLLFLLSRDNFSLSDSKARNYHHVKD